MKSATYEIVGCRGSQSYKQTGEYDSMPDARKAAREANQQNADGLGLSFRKYAARSEGDEGWTVAGKPGFKGHKTGR